LTDYLILVPIGYLIGSVPFGLLAGKLVARVDVRDFGSGRIGMTNVLRVAGKRAAAGVLLLDMGKGVVAVVLARYFFDSPGAEAASALAVIFGHNWPVFIGFRGGRGTASGWGALLVLSPIAGLIATVIGLTLVAATRYVSLGSVSAAALGSVAIIALALTGIYETPPVYTWYGAIGGTLIVLRHRDNIRRLLNGTERKIGQQVDLAGGH
jgi:glycerol-3-phosphate acyltransferase PlsY